MSDRREKVAISLTETSEERPWVRLTTIGVRHTVGNQSARMYSMDNLLTLVSAEAAQELRFRVGTPPVIVLEDEHHALEGPPITAELAEQLLRSIANTRQMRELRARGAVEFIYAFNRTSPFLVRARIEGEGVGFYVR